MPRLPCALCSNWVTVKLKHYKIVKEDYIAICYNCRNYHKKEIIPDEYRCNGISITTKNRCKSWANFNQGSKYCSIHKGDEKNE